MCPFFPRWLHHYTIRSLVRVRLAQRRQRRSYARYLTRQERYLCYYHFVACTYHVLFFRPCAHTHRGPYVTSLSRQEGRQKQRNQAIFAFSNPLLNEMYSLSPLSTSCAQAYIHVPLCYRKPPEAVFPYNNSLAVKIIFHSLLASTSPQTKYMLYLARRFIIKITLCKR